MQYPSNFLDSIKPKIQKIESMKPEFDELAGRARDPTLTPEEVKTIQKRLREEFQTEVDETFDDIFTQLDSLVEELKLSGQPGSQIVAAKLRHYIRLMNDYEAMLAARNSGVPEEMLSSIKCVPPAVETFRKKIIDVAESVLADDAERRNFLLHYLFGYSNEEAAYIMRSEFPLSPFVLSKKSTPSFITAAQRSKNKIFTSWQFSALEQELNALGARYQADPKNALDLCGCLSRLENGLFVDRTSVHNWMTKKYPEYADYIQSIREIRKSKNCCR